MIGLIILAAGPSTRLGEPKQKLNYGGKSLIRHAVDAALASDCFPTIVVLGAHSETILPEISGKPVHISVHDCWQEGMASSIRDGMRVLQNKAPQTEGVILMLCDQPFADAALLNQLIQKKQASGKAIVASAYQDTLGVPALFDKTVFPELTALSGEEGAKKIILKDPKSVVTVPFPHGGIDVDTWEDYKKLKQ